jgi:hypothetical protein
MNDPVAEAREAFVAASLKLRPKHLVGDMDKLDGLMDALIAAVRADEREACARLIEDRRRRVLDDPADPSWTEHFAELLAAIRQRGEGA